MKGPPLPERSSSSLTENETYGDSDKATGALMTPIPESEGEGENPEARAAEKKVAKTALRIWESKDSLMERVEAQWKVNAARRMGISNAKVLYSEADTHWTAYLPRDASPDTTPDVNKAATLCRRMTALVFADPPAPEVIPSSGEDEDVAAAEFSERALIDLQGETGLNEAEKARGAFDLSNTFGSGYVHYFVDSRGGGKKPIRVQARRDATHVDNALTDPATIAVSEEGKPIPGSGVEGPEPTNDGKPGQYFTRYVRPDGSLTDKKAEAATRWAPAIKSEVLDGRHVRLIPHTADDIWDAHGCQIAWFKTWGELKRLSPDLARLEASAKARIFEFRPKNADDLMPGGSANDVDVNENEDERLCFGLTTYYYQCGDYPKGLYLITVADEYVLHRSEWVAPAEQAEEPLDIPVTQYAQFAEGRRGYWKVSLMEIVGGGNELRAAQIGHWLDYMEKLNNRKGFIPTNSIINAEDMALPQASYLPVNPGGEPSFEDIPPYPADGLNFIAQVSGDMDSASGLLETGEEASKAGSGRQAYAIISQVHAGLSEPRTNVIRGYVRGSRITLQLARAFYDVPTELKWNEHGQYRHKAWTGADLTTTTDVRVKAGTMTMLSPAGKMQLAEHFASLQIVPPDELREILSSKIGGTIGLQDDPFRNRVRNQLAQWAEGPPDGWAPVLPPAPIPGPMGPVQPPAAPDPAFSEIFEPTPCDTLPNVAQIRVTEIARFMATGRYLRWPVEWRAGLNVEYDRMIAATAPPVPLQPGAQQGQPQNGAGPKQEGPKPPLSDLKNDAMREGAPPELVGA